jgi:hypothetical protein
VHLDLKASETFPLFISLEVKNIENSELTGILSFLCFSFCSSKLFSFFLYSTLKIESLLKIFWLSSFKTRYLGFSKIEFNLSITDGDGYSIPFNIIFFPKIKHFGIIPKRNEVIVFNPSNLHFLFFFEYYPLFL